MPTLAMYRAGHDFQRSAARGGLRACVLFGVDGAEVGLPLVGDLGDGVAEVGGGFAEFRDLVLLDGEGGADEGAEVVVGGVGALDGALDALQAVVRELLFEAFDAGGAVVAFRGHGVAP